MFFFSSINLYHKIINEMPNLFFTNNVTFTTRTLFKPSFKIPKIYLLSMVVYYKIHWKLCVLYIITPEQVNLAMGDSTIKSHVTILLGIRKVVKIVRKRWRTTRAYVISTNGFQKELPGI